MTQRDDPLKRRPRTQRQDQIEDETEERLSRELTHLMRDPRYQGGDPDYRAYIQRQFRRVYDDPTGKPQGLRIGRPKPFVSELEPFHAERERRLRLGIKDEAVSGEEKRQKTRASNRTILGGAVAGEQGRQRRVTGPSLAAANRQGGKTSPASRRNASSPVDQPLPATDQAESQTVPGPSIAHRRRVEAGMGDAVAKRSSESDERRFPDDPELRERSQRALKASEAMIEYWGGLGFDLFAEYLQRYIDREGGTTELPWSMLEEYSFVPNGVETVRGHYDKWLAGELEDETVGAPFLSMADGGTLRLGESGYESPVRWEGEWIADAITLPANWVKDGLLDPHDTDFLAAFGDAEVVGYGDFTFVRRGNVVHVVGEVDMRFDETFDFEEKGVVETVSSLTPGSPVTNDRDMGELAKQGLAKTFRTVSNRLWIVTGQITLDDGGPDVEDFKLKWREIDPAAPVPGDPGER